MNKARYIVLEGTEGVGKTTQVELLSNYLKNLGFKVLVTKEPGTPHSPLTMELRNIMLNAAYEPEMTKEARELVSQAIRSVHLAKVVAPAIKEYDFIIQDRGILSGLSYGVACGNDFALLELLAKQVTSPYFADITNPYFLYDDVIYLRGNVELGLNKAKSAKQEFAAGDAMELRGNGFMANVQENMDTFSKKFNTSLVDVDGKSREEVLNEILFKLGLSNNLCN